MKKIFVYQHSKISYSIEGKGKAVVLLHGFGEDSHIWDEQISFLKNSCRLIIPDLPGTGSSEKLIAHYPSPHPVSIEDYASCIHALLLHENIDRCTLLGHSMGGYIALAFAEKYSSFLSGFGLIHSTAYADSEEKKVVREKAIGFMEKNGGYAFLKNSIPNLFGKLFKEHHPEKIDLLIEASKSFDTASLQQYYLAMKNRPNRSDVLKGNRLPVLFVIGTEDVAAPPEDVLPQTQLPNNAYIHVLQNTGHMGMWEATTELNNSMLDFINKT